MGKTGIDDLVDQIKVINGVDVDVEVVNPTSLEMIGKGRQGAIFRVAEDRCMKVFGNVEDCEREYYALSLGQTTELFPRIYEKGPNYIVMDYVIGVDLREYLQSQQLTLNLSLKLIEMLVTFKEIGFQRIDHHKRQIYVQPDGTLKVIDVGRTVWRDRVYPYPRKLLTSLGENHRAVFLSHVQALAPELYQEWQYYRRMEDAAHQAYQLLMVDPSDERIYQIRSLISGLIEVPDEVRMKQIEGLFYKVLKEQRVREADIRRQVSRDVESKIRRLEDDLLNQQISLQAEKERTSTRWRQAELREGIARVRRQRHANRKLRHSLFVPRNQHP